jgi:hypothetical protein
MVDIGFPECGRAGASRENGLKTMQRAILMAENWWVNATKRPIED